MAEIRKRRTSPALTWHESSFDQLGGPALYAILAARVEVFVVEQDCPYQDLDGLDAASLHLWAADAAGRIVAYARITPPGSRFAEASIGRVLTAMSARRTGLGWELMHRAIALAERQFPGSALRISAQQYLERFYTALGFSYVRGPYPEDGIPHIEMLRSEQGKR